MFESAEAALYRHSSAMISTMHPKYIECYGTPVSAVHRSLRCTDLCIEMLLASC